SMLVLFLTGCNQVEEILGKVNQILDEQLAEDSVDEASDISSAEQADEREESVDTEADANEPVTEATETAGNGEQSLLPFDERLMEQGYEIMTLPNGIPVSIPYHWLLVEVEQGGSDFAGKFCFDLPLELEQVAEQFVSFNHTGGNHTDGTGETLLVTSFTLVGGYEI